MHKIIEKLNWRYATKVFNADKKISQTDRDSIIESFRLSPSSFGLQPWKLVLVQDQNLKDALVEHSWGQKQISDCSDLFVLCRKDNFSDTNIEEFISDIAQTRWITTDDLKWYEDMMKWFMSQMDESQKNTWIDKQIYIALGTMMTVCADIEVDACPIEWFDPAKYDEILWLNEKWISSVVVLPVWYRDSSDSYIDLKKVRFSKEEILEII